jgi:CHAD domain-containing protein
MEIEAKFAVPNRAAYRDLLRLRELAGYALVPAGATAQVVDRYFDTADGRVLGGGYALRIRTEGDAALVTLKGLGGSSGAVHRRDEQEEALPELALDVAAWPASPARDLALQLTGGMTLEPLFELSQRRARRDVMDGARRVAQFSLDDVRAAVGQRPAFYYELEIELAPDGTEADLATIAEALQSRWGLTPEPHSKFERALATLQRRGAPVEGGLTADEQAALAAYVAGTDAELARRAATILAWADGLPTREIVARTGLSSGRVRFWLRSFRAERMDIFQHASSIEPPAGLQAEPPQAAADAAVEAGQGVERRNPGRRRGLPTVRQFGHSNGVDLAHARCVAALAGALFDALRPVHRLPRKRRRLLRQAALLYTVGAVEDAEHPHRAGRDLILSQPMRNVSTSDRLALAALVALNRNRARPEREPAMSALDPKMQQDVMAMTALLQLAEALDFSRTQATQIERLESEDGVRVEATLTGPAATVDAMQATGRAALWYDLFGQQLVFVAEGSPDAGLQLAQPAAPEAPAPQEAAPAKPIASDEPMSEAGRDLLALHYGRMVANEEGSRLGEDIEAVHDMRVATRRMRAAFQVFDPYYKDKAVKPHIKGLRRTGQTLGAVRDLDVLLEKARAFQAELPEEDRATMAPLIIHWEAAREMARRELIEYLDGDAYREFKTEFESFLSTPGEGALEVPPGQPVPHLVRHVAPQLIFERYETVRAYDTLIPGMPLTTYHLLRIDFKRLRYALEFFKDVLGPESLAVIKQTTAVQDLLGELQDAHVAEGLINDFLTAQQKRKKKAQPPSLAGVEHYLAYQHDRQATLLQGFAPLWETVTGREFRRGLALAVAAI